MTKWTLRVPSSMAKKRTWRAAKEAFVATSSVGVGPGVKMDSHSCAKKDAMLGVCWRCCLVRGMCYVCVGPRVEGHCSETVAASCLCHRVWSVYVAEPLVLAVMGVLAEDGEHTTHASVRRVAGPSVMLASTGRRCLVTRGLDMCIVYCTARIAARPRQNGTRDQGGKQHLQKRRCACA